jgi:hypothetical protein
MQKRSGFQLCFALWVSIAFGTALRGEVASGDTADSASQRVLVSFADDVQFIGGPGTPHVVFAKAFSIPVFGDLAPSHLHYGHGSANEFGFQSSDYGVFFALQFYKLNKSSGPVSLEDLQAAASNQANLRWKGILTTGTAVEVEKNSKCLVELHYSAYLHDRSVPVIDRFARVDSDLMRVSVVPTDASLTPDQFTALHAAAEPTAANLLQSATALASQNAAGSANSGEIQSHLLHDPAAPAWAASDSSEWPSAVMVNRGVLTGNTGIGGCGFLFRLPSKIVVAGTVLHVFGEDTKIDALPGMIKSWTMATADSRKELRIGALAMNINPDSPTNPVDCVIADVSQLGDYPVEVLTPRISRLAVDEVVYVAGISRESGRKAAYHRAKVVYLYDAPARVDYIFDEQISTNGFSGAPILDSRGLLVGIHQGHSSTPDGRKDWYGLPIASAIAVANPKVAVVHGVKPAAPSTDGSSAAADRAFDMAQNYVIADKYDFARAKLQELIARYPKTAAAKKAKAALDGIAGK